MSGYLRRLVRRALGTETIAREMTPSPTVWYGRSSAYADAEAANGEAGTVSAVTATPPEPTVGTTAPGKAQTESPDPQSSDLRDRSADQASLPLQPGGVNSTDTARRADAAESLVRRRLDETRAEVDGNSEIETIEPAGDVIQPPSSGSQRRLLPPRPSSTASPRQIEPSSPAAEMSPHDPVALRREAPPKTPPRITDPGPAGTEPPASIGIAPPFPSAPLEHRKGDEPYFAAGTPIPSARGGRTLADSGSLRAKGVRTPGATLPPDGEGFIPIEPLPARPPESGLQFRPARSEDSGITERPMASRDEIASKAEPRPPGPSRTGRSTSAEQPRIDPARASTTDVQRTFIRPRSQSPTPVLRQMDPIAKDIAQPEASPPATPLPKKRRTTISPPPKPESASPEHQSQTEEKTHGHRRGETAHSRISPSLPAPPQRPRPSPRASPSEGGRLRIGTLRVEVVSTPPAPAAPPQARVVVAPAPAAQPGPPLHSNLRFGLGQM
jgi:hypothetical protein